MTLQEIADEINGLFHKYGLDHSVVKVIQGEPEIVFIQGRNQDAMELLLTSLQFIFDGFFEAHPASDQMRLF